MPNILTIILLYALGMFVLIYVFTVIPGKKKNKQVRAMHDAVKPGDEVVTSGLGGLFPKGLLVGRVAKVEPDAAGLYQTAWIESAADLGELEYAFVAATEKDLAAVPPAEPAGEEYVDELTGDEPEPLEGEEP